MCPTEPGNYLIAAFNDTLFSTYDFAMSGATLNITIAEKTPDTDVALELERTFLLNYEHNSSIFTDNLLFSFQSVSTMFLPFWRIWATIIKPLICSYTTLTTFNRNLIDQLYNAGARNFLFLNVPPLEKDS
ncbi:hypothetical protein CHU98_g3806 [Xylaria longipes]|nr:hypothetical protein CHU98_g3806 [Xylaria longipes]